MKGMALSGMIVAALGCGAQATPVSLGDALAPPPESLVTLATRIRGEGGYVFVGVPATTPVPVDSDSSPAPYGLRVEFPRARASVNVTHALGASMDSTLVLEGAAGEPVLVNADGSAATGYVLEQDDPDEWRRREIPASGTFLFFVVPQDSGFAVVWRTPSQNDTASGEGTSTGADIAIAELAIAPTE